MSPHRRRAARFAFPFAITSTSLPIARISGWGDALFSRCDLRPVCSGGGRTGCLNRFVDYAGSPTPPVCRRTTRRYATNSRRNGGTVSTVFSFFLFRYDAYETSFMANVRRTHPKRDRTRNRRTRPIRHRVSRTVRRCNDDFLVMRLLFDFRVVRIRRRDRLRDRFVVRRHVTRVVVPLVERRWARVNLVAVVLDLFL